MKIHDKPATISSMKSVPSSKITVWMRAFHWGAEAARRRKMLPWKEERKDRGADAKVQRLTSASAEGDCTFVVRVTVSGVSTSAPRHPARRKRNKKYSLLDNLCGCSWGFPLPNISRTHLPHASVHWLVHRALKQNTCDVRGVCIFKSLGHCAGLKTWALKPEIRVWLLFVYRRLLRAVTTAEASLRASNFSNCFTQDVVPRGAETLKPSLLLAH